MMFWLAIDFDVLTVTNLMNGRNASRVCCDLCTFLAYTLVRHSKRITLYIDSNKNISSCQYRFPFFYSEVTIDENCLLYFCVCNLGNNIQTR